MQHSEKMVNPLRPRQMIVVKIMIEHPIRHGWVDGMEIIAAVKQQVKRSRVTPLVLQ